METSGAIDIAPVDSRAHVILDVKCRAAGWMTTDALAKLDRLTTKDEAKFVLADRTDYEWARDMLVQHALPGRCTVLLSPVFGALDPRQLAEWVGGPVARPIADSVTQIDLDAGHARRMSNPSRSSG